MSKEAMKLALEALKADQKLIEAYRPKSHTNRLLNAIKALEEALAKQQGQSNFCPQCEALARELKAAKQEQGKPVAWSDAYDMIDRFLQNNLNSDADYAEYSKALDSIYTTPPQRKPLTDEDLDLICEKALFCRISFQQFARSIEAAHGIIKE